MSFIKFALISFLFLLGGNLCAQDDLFAEERAYKLAGGNLGAVHRVSPYGYTTGIGAGTWNTNMKLSPDTLKVYLKSYEMTDFTWYVNESYFDSILSYYNSSDFAKMLFKHPDSLSIAMTDKEPYYKLFRKTYGAVQSQTAIKRTMVTFRDSLFRLATITYQVYFKNVSGRLSITLNITKKEKPYFEAMRFTPHDLNEVSFFSNISNLSLEYLKGKNIGALMSDASTSFQKRINNKKKFEKSLAALNCDSLKQFTSNLSLEGNTIYARVIYDMPKEDKYLALVYVNEDNKFKLEDLVFINKKRD